MAKKSLPKIVSEKAFRKAVEKLRVKEKKNTRERDKVSALRRRLPMMEMKNEYIFKGPYGEKSLLDLFECRKQLTSFNEDLGIDGNREHALSVFVRDGNKVYRTYYTGGRGVEYMGTPWAILDMTPFGRQEKWEDSPKGWPQTEMYTWWQFHDEYK
ncbi:DUF899 family protein [Bdellovibrio sp. BCCA]|uniref:DUF899 family protein n=1 Tax=Bdellovibrio sp. BCCA TaxID=3136281 RepID=UPI0030F08142